MSCYFLRLYWPKRQGIFYEKKRHSCLVTLASKKPKESLSPFNPKKKTDMIYIRPKIVAKTQDVPLDGTIFFGNRGVHAHSCIMGT